MKKIFFKTFCILGLLSLKIFLSAEIGSSCGSSSQVTTKGIKVSFPTINYANYGCDPDGLEGCLVPKNYTGYNVTSAGTEYKIDINVYSTVGNSYNQKYCFRRNPTIQCPASSYDLVQPGSPCSTIDISVPSNIDYTINISIQAECQCNTDPGYAHSYGFTKQFTAGQFPSPNTGPNVTPTGGGLIPHTGIFPCIN